MRFKYFVVFLTVALLLPAAFCVQARTLSHVVVSELLWMGSASSSADEWIELKNTEPVAVDVSGWKLTRLSSGFEVTMLTIPMGKTIAPNGYFLISNFSESSPSSELAIVPDVVDSAVSLLNSGLQIKLYDAQNTLIDTADDGVGSPLAGAYTSGKVYASMARNGLSGDGTSAGSWHTSTTSTNLRPGSKVAGTPREANDNVPPRMSVMVDMSVTVGEAVQFDATDAVDPDGDILTYAWNFGDSGVSTDVAPTHVYPTAGKFTATLNVADGSATSTASWQVAVAAVVPAVDPAAPLIGRVELSELWPNPVGTDDHEFIELTAPDGEVDVSGWMLKDESGTTYTIPPETSIASGAYVLFMRSVTKIALNNDGDVVTLLRPDATVADTVSYIGAMEGAAYIRTAKGWAWTTKPSPASANIFVRLNHAPTAKFSVSTVRRAGTSVTFDGSDSSDVDDDALRLTWEFGDGTSAVGAHVKHTYQAVGAVRVRLTVRDALGATDIEERNVTIREPLKGATKKKSGTVKGAAVVTTLADIQAASSTTEVVLNGWVSVVPGALGDGLFYVSDGVGGIAVRSNGKLPKLTLGDPVTAHGEKRTKSGEPYVLVENEQGIVLGTPSEHKVIAPTTLQADALGTDDVGSLVQVEGEVTSLNGSRFSIDDGSGEVDAYVKATTGFKRPGMRAGDRVRVIGIVSTGTSGLRILPRMKDDVVVTAVNHPADNQNVIVPPAKKPPLWGYSLVLMAAVGGYVIAQWRKARMIVK